MMWDLIYGHVDSVELLEEYPDPGSNASFKATTEGLWHVAHCLDYIRQSLQCNADTSLEWPVEVNGQTLVVGWDNPHECKKWEALWEFAQQHS